MRGTSRWRASIPLAGIKLRKKKATPRIVETATELVSKVNLTFLLLVSIAKGKVLSLAPTFYPSAAWRRLVLSASSYTWTCSRCCCTRAPVLQFSESLANRGN